MAGVPRSEAMAAFREGFDRVPDNTVDTISRREGAFVRNAPSSKNVRAAEDELQRLRRVGGGSQASVTHRVSNALVDGRSLTFGTVAATATIPARLRPRASLCPHPTPFVANS
jgi:hypothetical protein